MRVRLAMGLAAAVPFLLLHQANEVRLLTKIERDGSGLRMYWCQGNPDRLEEVRRRLREASPDFEEERERITSEGFVISRSWRPHTLAMIPDTRLEISDIARSPLSLYTTFTWEEKLTISAETATASEQLAAGGTKLVYILQMPGKVDEASVSPPATVEGGTVTWVLTADRGEYQLRATSKTLRWDLLVLSLYLVAVLVWKGGGFALREARRKPRRI
ncbi:MAG: hypothetical protein N2512_13775 [Armatimonadetes bacterium]|nr:hypothetical protein [Armatimonadota bacterium]